MVAGLDNDFQGHIQCHGENLAPTVGYVFQNPRLLPWRTVRQNIELVFADKPPATMIDALLEAMQMTAYQDMYAAKLSVGMARRVALIRAFAINPDILLMDEPFVSLDPPTARQVYELLLQLWQQHRHSVLFVTHDLNEAIALADRLVFLSAAPMQVLGEYTIPLPRHQRQAGEAIAHIRQHLLVQQPQIGHLL
jgi:ABC-type nitrate/sulfonate/bicarbonate transport system ATPase subunit